MSILVQTSTVWNWFADEVVVVMVMMDLRCIWKCSFGLLELIVTSRCGRGCVDIDVRSHHG